MQKDIAQSQELAARKVSRGARERLGHGHSAYLHEEIRKMF
jgi:hypothetical protein